MTVDSVPLPIQFGTLAFTSKDDKYLTEVYIKDDTMIRTVTIRTLVRATGVWSITTSTAYGGYPHPADMFRLGRVL